MPATCIPAAQEVIVNPEYFYDVRYRSIWELMVTMHPAEINLITVQQKLKDQGLLEGIGGLMFLAKCQNDVTTTSNIAYWLAIVQEKHILRQIIITASDAIGAAYDCEDQPHLLLDKLEREFLSIRPGQRQAKDIRHLVAEAINNIEYRFQNPDKIIGLPTGLGDLDRLTDGCHDGEMIVPAGYPSTGKTALAVNIAVHNALAGVPVAIFTAEMQPVQLTVRSLCSSSGANYRRLTEGSLQKMMVEAPKLAASKIFIEPAHGLTIGQVYAIARRLKQQHKIRMIVIDYIQLLSGTGDNREQEVASISKGIKAMSGELQIPILALSQLNEAGKLRESRSIGQDADSIWMLKNDGEWNAYQQPIILNVEKCRDGETGPVRLHFDKTCTKFKPAEKISPDDHP